MLMYVSLERTNMTAFNGLLPFDGDQAIIVLCSFWKESELVGATGKNSTVIMLPRPGLNFTQVDIYILFTGVSHSS